MLKVFALLTKKQGMETQAFIDYYENHHVPLICSLAPSPIVYKRNYLVRGDELNVEDAAIGFDIITELVFPDRAAFLAWMTRLFAPVNGGQVAADEERFLDRSRIRSYVIEEHVTARRVCAGERLLFCA